MSETWPGCVHRDEQGGRYRPFWISAFCVASVALCAVSWWRRPSLASSQQPAALARRVASAQGADPLGDFARKMQGQQGAPLAVHEQGRLSSDAGAPAVAQHVPVEETADRPRQVNSSEENLIYLQVASFQKKETAEQVAADLAKKGLRAVSIPYGMVRGQWWHAVRVGPYDKRLDAEKERLSLPPLFRNESVTLPRVRGAFHLRVGTFDTKDKAERMSRQMHERGHRTRMLVVPNGQVTWYGVYVGAFETRQDAEEYRAVLRARDEVVGEVVSFATSTSQ